MDNLVSDCCNAPILYRSEKGHQGTIEEGDTDYCSECQWDCHVVKLNKEE